MQCRDVGELTDAFLSDQLLVETTQQMVHHLQGCPSCRDELSARRTLRARLQAAFSGAQHLAPRPEFLGELRDRLRPQVANLSRRTWLRSWLAVAAGAIGLVGGGLFVRRGFDQSARGALARSATGDHQNCAVRFNLGEQPISLDEAAKRFDPAYASLAAMELPTGPSGPLTVLARHSCVYDGRRFGHIVFQYQGALTSLLVTPLDSSLAPSPTLLPPVGNVQVAAFSAGRFAAFVVSDASEAQVRSLANMLAGPVSQRLAEA